MNNPQVQVPVSLLLDPEWTASAKVLWMGLRLAPSAGPAQLEALTGLPRRTIRRGLGRGRRTPGGVKVKIPGALLAERSVGAQAKVLYGLLQSTARWQSGAFTFPSLVQLTQLSPNTLKRAIKELADSGWVELNQASRLKPIHFKLGSPEQRRSQREAIVAARRLKRAEYRGEALMQEYLSLLIELDDFADNVRPGFLVNPQSGERMELDRFYPPRLAFEYNGTQHYEPTEAIPLAAVEAQQSRDLVKAGLCLYRGIQLVIIHAEDLTLQGMIDRLPLGVPRRSLAGHEPLIEVLEDASIRYQALASAAKGRRPGSSS